MGKNRRKLRGHGRGTKQQKQIRRIRQLGEVQNGKTLIRRSKRDYQETKKKESTRPKRNPS